MNVKKIFQYFFFLLALGSAQAQVNIPFFENFEDPQWNPTINGVYLVNPDGDVAAWERTTDASGYAIGLASARLDNFNHDTRGTLDWLHLPSLDFSGAQGVSVVFDIAYAKFDNILNDTLVVVVSIDSGNTYSMIFQEGGDDLATAPAETGGPFIPLLASEWDSRTLDLGVYDGESNVSIGFINAGGWGQNLYVDNITVTAVILPVELSRFIATLTGDFVELTWETASESNIEGFEVQKSKNSENWESLNFVQGQGTSHEAHTYEYIDKEPAVGTNYYRLKQIDSDGSSVFSEIISVNIIDENNSWNLRITPNPVQEGYMTLYYNEIKNTEATFRLLDISGRLLQQQPLFGTEATINISGIQPGVYFAEVMTRTRVAIKKVVVK